MKCNQLENVQKLKSECNMYKKILITVSFLVFFISPLNFSQEIEANLGGNTSSDGFSVKNNLGKVLFRVNGDGNVGIGTTTPSTKFELSGSDALVYGLTIGRGTGNALSNSVFGHEALYSNTTGTRNTAFGESALYANTIGYGNTANGCYALNSNTEGYYNTGIGFKSLLYNSTGILNTAIGAEALHSNTTGNENTATGYRSLYYNTDGLYNTATGNQALFYNTTGNWNTASGYKALYLNSTGQHNTANGTKALYSNTTGSQSTANGENALLDNTTGSNNTASGFDALRSNKAGSRNTGYGIAALGAILEQDNNTAVGAFAGTDYTFSEGTFLGAYALPNSSSYSNVMGLGYNAIVTASNQVRIGNSFVTSIGGYAGWTNFSDGRYKLVVNENVKGIDFIMKLRPVTYQLDMSKLSVDLREDQRRDEKGNVTAISSDIDIKSRNEKSQIVYTGFVAQEVERAARELGFDFSGIDAPKNENDFYGLRYAEFVVPLVKAVQEQQKIIEELTKRIEALERKK
jgi:hypothetical protein